MFYLAEAMIQAGIANGLDPSVADVLTRQTLLGASTLLTKSGVTPEELRTQLHHQMELQLPQFNIFNRITSSARPKRRLSSNR